MERESRPAPRTPLELYQALKQNALLGKDMDPNRFLADLSQLDKTGAVRKHPSLQQILLQAGKDPLLRTAALARLGESRLAHNNKVLTSNLRLIKILGIEPSAAYLPKKRGFKTRVALAFGAGLVATASVVGSAGPTFLSPGKAKESTTTGQTNSQEESNPVPSGTGPTTPTAIVTFPKPQISPPSPTKPPLPTEAPKPTEVPAPEIKVEKEDLLRGVIAPNIYKEVVNKRDRRINEDPDFAKRIDQEGAQNRINVLLLGVDAGGKLTDSIMIFSYHLPSHSLSLISIPRDLMAPEVLKKTGSASNSRINQAFAVGGIELAKRALENATALPLDLTMVVGFDFLEDLINQTVGTIEVEITEPFNDPTVTSMTKGRHTVDGTRAVTIARSRLGSAGGDYDRIDRLQLIANGLIQRLQERGQNTFEAIKIYNAIRDLLQQKKNKGAVEMDFDVDMILPPIFSPKTAQVLPQLPQLLWNKLTKGQWKIGERPKVSRLVISNKNFVVGAGIPGASITKIAGGDPYSPDTRGRYWAKIRQAVESLLNQKVVLPKTERVLYPKELSYPEVTRWIGKLRGTHESVISESLFTRELSNLFKDQREKVLLEIAKAHAEALIEHFGNAPALIGLDPGHGGTDIGSSTVTAEGESLAEKKLTWQLTKMIAEEIYQQTGGLYTVVILRPEEPNDRDLDEDGTIAPVERIQPHKALLLEIESKLRAPQDRGRYIVYLSVHFDGSSDPNQKGTSVYWPNEVGEPNAGYREGSKNLAQILQRKIVEHLKAVGFPVVDLGALMDPDKRQPSSNSETKTGPYLALGSPKLDRVLRNTKERDIFPQK